MCRAILSTNLFGDSPVSQKFTFTENGWDAHSRNWTASLFIIGRWAEICLQAFLLSIDEPKLGRVPFDFHEIFVELFTSAFGESEVKFWWKWTSAKLVHDLIFHPSFFNTLWRTNLLSNSVEAVPLGYGEEEVASQVLDLTRPLQEAPEHLNSDKNAFVQCGSALGYTYKVDSNALI